MKKTILLTLAMAMLAALPLGSVFAFEAFQGATEVRIYDETQTYDGYTLFCPLGATTQYLIDMKGNVVHTWDCETGPGLYGYLMDDGVLLRGSGYSAAGTADTSGLLSSGGSASGVQEIDWDGNILWDWEWYSDKYRRHHDFRKIWNNALGEYTYISIEWTWLSGDDAIALGADPTYSSEWAATSRHVEGFSPGGVVEVNANQEVIWRWSFADHCVQNYDPTKTADFVDVNGIQRSGATYGDPEDYPGKINTNALTYGDTYHVPVNDWQHCNSLDYNVDLDHIVINAKHWSEFYVMDHGGTFVAGNPTQSIANARSDAGDFLYRFGNPAAYNQGDPAGYHTEGDQQMYASHDVQWIGGANTAYDASELHGAGNFLIFDNGTWCTNMTHSEVLEIDGYDEAAGAYVNPPDAGYQTGYGGSYGGVGAASYNLSNQVAWFFRSNYCNSFCGTFISGAQRLPNGNTLICSGPTGHFFEVTDDKEVIWEYINPVQRTGAIQTTQYDSDGNAAMTFRCFRYDADHPALAGKALYSQGTITGEPDWDGNLPTFTGWGFAGTALGEGSGGAGGGGGGGY